MLEAYRQHVADRAAQNIPPTPLSPEQVADLLELLENPPAGEDLLKNSLYFMYQVIAIYILKA